MGNNKLTMVVGGYFILFGSMTDGFLLKPSRPMRSIDSTFLQRAFGAGGPSGELWTTMTQVRKAVLAERF